MNKQHFFVAFIFPIGLGGGFHAPARANTSLRSLPFTCRGKKTPQYTKSSHKKKCCGIKDINDIAHRIDFIVKMFGTKTKAWQYEKEIRLLYTTFGIKHYSPFALKAVYFGLDLGEQYQNIIIDGLQNRDVKFYKMNRKENSYEILPVFLCENSRKIDTKLPFDLYEILKTDHNHTVENFHILYKGVLKDEATLQTFSNKFREKYATKEANVFIYDDKSILDLIGKYPLYGDDQYRLANHLIAMSTFDDPNGIWMYPDKG